MITLRAIILTCECGWKKDSSICLMYTWMIVLAMLQDKQNKHYLQVHHVPMDIIYRQFTMFPSTLSTGPPCFQRHYLQVHHDVPMDIYKSTMFPWTLSTSPPCSHGHYLQVHNVPMDIIYKPVTYPWTLSTSLPCSHGHHMQVVHHYL